MGSHNVCTHWMYKYYGLYLAWWWLNEPKHVAEFLMLIINICCVYWLIKLLYYRSSNSKRQFLGCATIAFSDRYMQKSREMVAGRVARKLRQVTQAGRQRKRPASSNRRWRHYSKNRNHVIAAFDRKKLNYPDS